LIPSQSKQKKGEIGYDGFKKIKGIKIGVSTEKNGLPLSIFISPANIHDSKLYLPIIENVKIKLPVGAPITRPHLINADAAFDSKEIRNYNRGRGIKSNIPVNPRNTKKKKIGRPRKLDKNIYKKRYVVERFFSWIEGFKKISPRYERLEYSYLGLVTLACSLMLWMVLG
jgi:transposase